MPSACKGRAVLQDLKVAALFLTRFPVQVDGKVTMRDLAAAVYAFPLMGAAVGLLGGLAFAAAGLARPAAPAGGAAGDRRDDPGDRCAARGRPRRHGRRRWAPAPTASGHWRSWRDSRIGSFGALALIVALLARLMALAPMWDPQLVTAVLVAAGMASRALMPVVMLLQPSAKADRPRGGSRPTGAGAGDARQLHRHRRRASCCCRCRWPSRP